MRRLVLLDDPDQVDLLEPRDRSDPGTRLVALSAGALERLEAEGLPCVPVRDFTRPRYPDVERELCRATLGLLRDLEAYVAERYPPARFDGLGLLAGQHFHVQYAASAVWTRTYILREAVRAFAPEEVVLFESEIGLYLRDLGFVRPPWLDPPPAIAGIRIVLRGGPPGPPAAARPAEGAGARLARALRGAAERAASTLRFLRPSGCGLRLLFVDAVSYDWHSVARRLIERPEAECFFLRSVSTDGGGTRHRYAPVVRRLRDLARRELGAPPPQPTKEDIRALPALFDAWWERGGRETLRVSDVDVAPALRSFLREMVLHAPALARAAEDLADRAVRTLHPDAACFFWLGTLSAVRFAEACRRRGVPVVGFNHGFGLGLRDAPMDDIPEFGVADHCLTYGEGVRLPAEPLAPVRAALVPVGSTRVEEMRRRRGAALRPPRLPVRVLWIGEVSTANTIGITNGVAEDTERYLAQREYLGILGASEGLRIEYRPVPHPELVRRDALPAWIDRTRPPRIRADAASTFEDLAVACDVAVSFVGAGTTWAEVLSLGRPLVVILDPARARYRSGFLDDLGRACRLCRTPAEAKEALHALARDPLAFLEAERRRDLAPFLRRYVLPRDDGRCVDDALAFLESLRWR